MKKAILILSLFLILALLASTLLLSGCTLPPADEKEDDNDKPQRASRTDRAGVGSASGYRRTIERPGAERDSATSRSSSRSSAGEEVTGRAISNVNYGTAGDRCLDRADCGGGIDCIDRRCGTIAELYGTECEEKCHFNQIVVSTSDGEEYTLSPGEGSYSYAGALEWQFVSPPEHCPGSDALVPIRLIKKANSQIVGEEVITLKEGSTSRAITHPTIRKVSFKVTLESIEDNC